EEARKKKEAEKRKKEAEERKVKRDTEKKAKEAGAKHLVITTDDPNFECMLHSHEPNRIYQLSGGDAIPPMDCTSAKLCVETVYLPAYNPVTEALELVPMKPVVMAGGVSFWENPKNH
ncbi:hypothetical protein DENSPDRAFT_886451, partial [Dentipellis sp. KUC8613]